MGHRKFQYGERLLLRTGGRRSIVGLYLSCGRCLDEILYTNSSVPSKVRDVGLIIAETKVNLRRYGRHLEKSI